MKKLEDAAGYVRMSTDKQEASPERQRAEITKLAEQHGCRVARWFEDLGMTGTESSKREDFQKLLRDCEKRKWRTVLYYEPSRLSREHPLDSLAHLNTFRKAGVRLISTIRGVVDCNDIGGLIISVVDAHASHDESIKIANRCVSGRRQKLLNGQRMAGAVFAYDREMIDDTGQVMRRVHFQERFTRPNNWKSRLVPSDDIAAVKAVQKAFRDFLQGTLISHIANEWNEAGLRSIFGNLFNHQALKEILANPVYCGTLVAAKDCTGKFRRMDEDGLIFRDDAHPAIVSRELFEAVQKELSRRPKARAGFTPGKYLLTSVIRCEHCGGPLLGSQSGQNTNAESNRRFYKSPPMYHAKDCCRPCIDANRIETAILEKVRKYVLTPRNVANISRLELGTVGFNEPSPEARQLVAIRKKIETGEANLAMADSPDDYRAIAKMLHTWREQAAELAKDLEVTEEIEADESAVGRTIAELARYADNIDKCDRWVLSKALSLLLDKVTVGHRYIGEGWGKHEVWSGTVSFAEGVCNDTIELTDRDLATAAHRVYWKVADYIVEQGRVVQLRELVEHFKTKGNSLQRHCARAVAAGLIIHLGHRSGWVAADKPKQMQHTA